MANGATIEGTKVLIQPLADMFGPFRKHLEDVGVVCVVVGVVDCFHGEYMCR